MADNFSPDRIASQMPLPPEEMERRKRILAQSFANVGPLPPIQIPYQYQIPSPRHPLNAAEIYQDMPPWTGDRPNIDQRSQLIPNNIQEMPTPFGYYNESNTQPPPMQWYNQEKLLMQLYNIMPWLRPPATGEWLPDQSGRLY